MLSNVIVTSLRPSSLGAPFQAEVTSNLFASKWTHGNQNELIWFNVNVMYAYSYCAFFFQQSQLINHWTVTMGGNSCCGPGTHTHLHFFSYKRTEFSRIEPDSLVLNKPTNHLCLPSFLSSFTPNSKSKKITKAVHVNNSLIKWLSLSKFSFGIVARGQSSPPPLPS